MSAPSVREKDSRTSSAWTSCRSSLPAAHEISRLVVLGGSATGLAVARSSYAQGLETIVADTHRSLASSSRCATFHELPSDGSELAVRELLALADGQPTAIIADSDAWLRFLQGWRDELDGAFEVLHAPPSSIATCLDKLQFNRWCRQHGIPSPTPYLCAEGGEYDVSFPVIVRPRLTCHHRAHDVPKAIECRSPSELRWAIERCRNASVDPDVCESLLRPATRCFSVGLARNARGETLSVTAERVRPLPEQCAAGTFVRLCPHPAVQELAERVAEKLDLYGIAEIEILANPGGPGGSEELSVVEVNARPWLQFPLADRSGHAMLPFLLNRPVRRPRHRRTDGVSWIDISADRYICFSRQRGLVWQGQMSGSAWLRAVCSAEAHPVWSWSDPGPLMHSLLPKWLRASQRGAAE